jgi:molybdenum cofactor biosynthesis enzyme MoaA
MNYYELAPDQNHFSDVMIDVTHRCNMTCKNCYIPNRNIPDMDIDKMIEAISKFPERTMIRIVGAEPTVRKDLPEIISRIRETGHRATLLTNGLKLGNNNYVARLKNAGLNHVYLSLNGVDNDAWYEQIDELPCADRKINALKNLQTNKFVIDTGTIIVKGINDEAPARLLHLYKNLDIKHALCRIKNVGKLGRSMFDDDAGEHRLTVNTNYTMDGLIKLIAEQVGVSVDYIESWRHRPIYQNTEPEESSFIFPLDHSNKKRFMHKSGIWFKIADWNTFGNSDGVPLPNNKRRGRLTENFTVAPMAEHVKLNEGEY